MQMTKSLPLWKLPIWGEGGRGGGGGLGEDIGYFIICICRCGCTGNEKKLSGMATGGIWLCLKDRMKGRGGVLP